MSRLENRLLGLQGENASLSDRLCVVVKMLADEFDNIAWNSLNIDYHPPKVERLWAQIGSMRLMVHRIHPVQATEAKDALFHPHPWPSAVFIISGSYEMGIGYGAASETPPLAAKVLLSPGSSYEMTDKNSWHYVSPRVNSSISLMLIDSPWDKPHPFYTEGEKVRLNPLTEGARQKVIEELKLGLEGLR